MNQSAFQRARKLTAVAMVLGILLSITSPGYSQEERPVDVQHFWNSPSESAALSILRQAFTDRGGVWVDLPVQNAQENREVAFRRILRGVPPFALHWFAGTDLVGMSQSGVIHKLTDFAAEEDWVHRIHPQVLSDITASRDVYALPMGIHTENVAWFNSALLNRYLLSAPSTWDGLIDLLTKAQADGVPGIAMGQDNWEILHLFLSILQSEAEAGLQDRLLLKADRSVLKEPDFIKVLSIMADLRPFQLNDPAVEVWSDATAAVADGKALVVFMGDWALPEFRARGMVAGRDFECEISIGRHKRQIAVVDVFVFPIANTRKLTSAHRKMIDAVLDENTQLAFSNAKGAMPVLSGIKAEKIADPCIRKAFSMFKRDASVPASVMKLNDQILAVIDAVVARFWNDPEISVNAMQSILDQELSVFAK